jgi:Spy/CpxP family protein refolding chaperone
MKNVRSFIVGSAILTVTTGAVMSSPSATFAQNEPAGKGGFGQRARMHRMGDIGAPLISIALKHRTELNLSNEQVASLEKIRTHYQEQGAPLQQQLRAIESEISELRQQSPANLIQIKLKIEQSEKVRSELRYLREEALENGKSILTAAQRDQLKTLAGSGHRGFRKGQSQTPKQS